MLALNAAGGRGARGCISGGPCWCPLVQASLLAFVLGPACKWLQRARLPRGAAVIVVVVLAFGAIGGIGLVVGSQASLLTDHLPEYETTVAAKWQAITTGGGWLQRLPRVSDRFSGREALTAESGLTLARTVAQPLLGPLSTAGIVLVFTVFILLSSAELRDRLVRLVRAARPAPHHPGDERCGPAAVALLPVPTGPEHRVRADDRAQLWGVGLPQPDPVGHPRRADAVRAVYRSIIALLPPLLLAVAVVPGWSMAIVVLALFLCSDLIMGQVVEPLIYGHSTGPLPIAVVFSAAFWTFLWGPVGLLLATPLTVCLVVIGGTWRRWPSWR